MRRVLVLAVGRPRPPSRLRLRATSPPGTIGVMGQRARKIYFRARYPI